MSNQLDIFRKEFLHAQSWTHRKDGVPLYLIDHLSDPERRIAEEEMINALSLNDDWPVQGLAHLRSQKALPRLYAMLEQSARSMKITIAHAIWQINGDASMAGKALDELPRINNQNELIGVLHLLARFGDQQINHYLQSLLQHPEYLVAYNAARVMGLPTDDVVKRFRGGKPAAQSPVSATPPPSSTSRIASPGRMAGRSSAIPAGPSEPAVPQERPPEWKWRLASMLLFGLSLALPAYCTGSTCSHSLVVFLIGWLGLLGGHAWSWLANPLLFMSWMTLRRSPRLSMILCMAAFIFAGSFMLSGSVLVNENGGQAAITSLHAGYWCWLLSTGVMMLGTCNKVYRLNMAWRAERLA